MSASDETVSIVLPVYNGSATVLRAITSCLEQSYPRLELIIVNDGSTDDTASLVDAVAQRDDRVTVIHTENRGVAEAFNTGLKAAHGKYIARMDADDEMHPGKISKQVAFLQANPDTGVVSCLVHYGGDRVTQEGYARHVDWINTLITPEEIALNRFVDSPVCNPSVLFRTGLIGLHGAALNGNFPEDYEMWLRWMRDGVRFAKVPEVLFTWNDPASRLTRNDDRYSSKAFELAKTQYLVQHILRNNATDRSIYLCGSGRITRSKSNFLRASGLRIGGYLEINPKKANMDYDGIPVIEFGQRPDKNRAFIVNYLSVRGAREELRSIFEKEGRVEGADFIMAG